MGGLRLVLNKFGELISKTKTKESEEIILYYNKKEKTYNLAVTDFDRLVFEQNKEIFIDVISVNLNGFEYIYTKGVSCFSRHYGQELLSLLNLNLSNDHIAKEGLILLSNALSVSQERI